MLFSAVILAGGQSTRMRRDKSWLQYNGRPLIVHQIETVKACRPGEILISANNGGYAGLGWPVISDRFTGNGPVGGIESALHETRAPFLFVLAVDMPMFSASMLRDLLRHCEPGRGVIPRVAGQVQPLAAIYPKAAHRILLHFMAEGIKSATRFAETCVAVGLAAYLDPPDSDDNQFANWNTPADVRANEPNK